MADPVTETELRSIYRETVDYLYAFVSRRCGGRRDLAQDVVQETWLRAVRVWRANGVPNVPVAWLTTVARNLILNDQRRREALSLDELSAAAAISAVDNDSLSDAGAIVSLVVSRRRCPPTKHEAANEVRAVYDRPAMFGGLTSADANGPVYSRIKRSRTVATYAARDRAPACRRSRA
jgi:DNA-directed RNA polymerase specialized sigma24 family protein